MNNSLAEGNKSGKINEKPNFLTVLKDLAAILSVVGIACYALGFTIVRIHLLKYEIGNINITVAKYISVGFFFLILMALTSIPAYFLSRDLTSSIFVSRNIFDIFSKNNKDFFSNFYRYIFLVFSFSILLPHIIIFLLLMWWDEPGQDIVLIVFKAVTLFIVIFPWYFFTIWIGVLIDPLVSKEEKNLRPSSRDVNVAGIPSQFFYTVLITIFLLLIVKFYTTSIYPYISPAFGGGRLAQIQLVTDNSNKDTLNQLVPIEPSTKYSSTSVPIWLLDENDKSYFILIYVNNRQSKSSVPMIKSRQFQAIQIDKSLIQGAKYLPRKNLLVETDLWWRYE